MGKLVRKCSSFLLMAGERMESEVVSRGVAVARGSWIEQRRPKPPKTLSVPGIRTDLAREDHGNFHYH